MEPIWNPYGTHVTINLRFKTQIIDLSECSLKDILTPKEVVES